MTRNVMHMENQNIRVIIINYVLNQMRQNVEALYF